MPDHLYVPMGLLGAGVVAWITAGVVFVLAPDAKISSDLLGAGTGAMALSAASYQVQVKAAPPKSTRKYTPRKPKDPTL